MGKEIIKRYSIAFKKQVVSEYESGLSLNALQKRYGMSINTVKKWVEQYGREGVRHKMVMIQQPEEQERVRKLEAQVQELQALVAQLSIDKFVLECTLAVAEEDLGYEVKKKIPTASSAKRKTSTKRPR
ncbi:MAG: transposase [Anaerolineales bacterium]|nr:transposase [Anaerolineales bacterium]